MHTRNIIVMGASYGGLAAYAQSKLALLLLTREQARREPRVAANVVHPGAIATGIWRDVPWPFRALLDRLLPPPEKGAGPVVRLAVDPALDGVTGRYFLRWKEAEPSPAARDDAETQHRPRFTLLAGPLDEAKELAGVRRRRRDEAADVRVGEQSGEAPGIRRAQFAQRHAIAPQFRQARTPGRRRGRSSHPFRLGGLNGGFTHTLAGIRVGGEPIVGGARSIASRTPVARSSPDVRNPRAVRERKRCP